MHDDLGWKNQTTRYILPHHWLYEWFSQFHSRGTYLVNSRSHSNMLLVKCSGNWPYVAFANCQNVLGKHLFDEQFTYFHLLVVEDQSCTWQKWLPFSSVCCLQINLGTWQQCDSNWGAVNLTSIWNSAVHICFVLSPETWFSMNSNYSQTESWLIC